jgi:hypothetical protein
MSIFTTMHSGVSVLPSPASRLPTAGDGASDSFSSLVNGRMPTPDDGQSSRLSIYSAISAETFGLLTNGLAGDSGQVGKGVTTGDVTKGPIPDIGPAVDAGPAADVTNDLLPGAGDGSTSDDSGAGDVTNWLPKVTDPGNDVENPIGDPYKGTFTNERPRVQV